MLKKCAAVVMAALVLVLFVGTGAASAHVTVSAPGATRGGTDQTISFRVPNESATAATTQLQVSFPTNTPIASVLPQAHPGWTITTTTVKLATPIHTDDGDITQAVSTVTWKAAGAGIPVGQFDQFTVIAGLLPDVASLTFGAIQTYSDGTVVKWIESPAPGSSAEPDHPAPVLSLAAVSGQATPGTSTIAAKSDNTGPIVLAVIALVVAAAALGFGFVQRARAARP